MQCLDKRYCADMEELMFLSNNGNLSWLCKWVSVVFDVVNLVFSDIFIDGMVMHLIDIEAVWLK